MINHPIPRPASSRDADDDQLGPGSFLWGRFVVFLSATATLFSLPDEWAKRFLGIIVVTGVLYALARLFSRRSRHA